MFEELTHGSVEMVSLKGTVSTVVVECGCARIKVISNIFHMNRQ